MKFIITRSTIYEIHYYEIQHYKTDYYYIWILLKTENYKNESENQNK